MSTVKLVANAKTGTMYVPTSSKKFWRVQMKSEGTVERDGFFFRQNQVGFAYFQNEQDCKNFIGSAAKVIVNDKEELHVAGKVVYLDQLTPIMEEATEYGKQYPYPFRFNGQELNLDQRVAVQTAAAKAGLSLTQSDQAIYRKKIYTTDLTRNNIILSPDNLDEVNNFVSKVLAGNPDTKALRLAELKAMTKAQRVAAGVQEEYVDLVG